MIIFTSENVLLKLWFTYAETEERKKASLPKKVTKGTLGVFIMRLGNIVNGA